MTAVTTPMKASIASEPTAPHEVLALLQNEVLPTLLDTTGDVTPRATEAWRQLVELPAKQSRAALVSIIHDDGDLARVRAAVATLGVLHRDEALPRLRDVLLGHGDAEVVAEAARRIVYSCREVGRELVRHWLSDGAAELAASSFKLSELLEELVREAHGDLAENLPWGNQSTRATLRAEAAELGAPELPSDLALVRQLKIFAREYVREVSSMAIAALRTDYGEIGRAACREVLMELRSPELSPTGEGAEAKRELRFQRLRELDECLVGTEGSLLLALRLPGLHDLGDLAVHRLMRARRERPAAHGADGALVTFLEQRATPAAVQALGELNASGHDDAQKALVRILRFFGRHSPEVLTQARIGYWRRPDVDKILPQISNLPELFGEGKPLEAVAREVASGADTRASLRQLQRLQEYAERWQRSHEIAALRGVVALQCRRWLAEVGDSSFMLTPAELRQFAVAAFDLGVQHNDESAGQAVMERVLAGYEHDQARFRSPLLAFFGELGRVSVEQIPSVCALSERVAAACGEFKDRTVLKEALALQYAPLGLVLVGNALHAAGEPNVELLVRKRIAGLRWGSLEATAQAEKLVLAHLDTGKRTLDRVVSPRAGELGRWLVE